MSFLFLLSNSYFKLDKQYRELGGALRMRTVFFLAGIIVQLELIVVPGKLFALV